MIELPWSEEAERSVLGAIMLDGLPVMEQCIRLRPEHFFLPTHADIFRHCKAILSRQADIHPMLVAEALGPAADLPYLAGLSEGLYRGWSAEVRVSKLIEMWKLRRGIEMCNRYQNAFVNGDSGELLASMQAEVLSIIAESSQDDDPLVATYSDALWDEFMDRVHRTDHDGFQYGCRQLDAHTGGMQPGQVTAVGARSGVGKTSLMKQATVANCRAGVPVTLFSLEASRAEILGGLWSIVSGVPYSRVNKPQIATPEERDMLRSAMRVVSRWPLRIYDKSELHIDEIVAYARMNVRRFGAKVIAVDYAQNVEADGRDERTKVSSVSRKLTKMTKDEGNALMLLSQLRKVPHEQYSKAPTMADFRETGQIENDCHVGLLLHRPWDEQNACISNTASIHIAKFRHGQTGAFEMNFDTRTLTFGGMNW